MNLQRGRVLLIEGPDAETNQEIRNAIACGRFEPVPASPGEALMIADQVDCLLLDGSALSGAEPLRLLSELWCIQPDLPVIVMIDGDMALKERALRAGVAAVLTTPFAEIELRAAVLMALQQREVGLSAFTREIARTMSTVATALEEANGLQAALTEITGLFHVKRASVLLYEDAIGAQAWADLADPSLPFEAECPAKYGDIPPNERMRMIAQTGIPADIASHIRVRRGEGISGEVGKEGIPRLILRPPAQHVNELKSGEVQSGDTRRSIQAGICVPIRAAGERGHGEILGVFSISRVEPGEIFTPRDLEICEFLAAHIGQVLSRRRLDDEQATLQQRLAATEKLTYAGELAAGIAHEVASPIGYVRANVRALGEYFDDLGPLLGAVKKALETGGNIDMAPFLGDAEELLDVLADLPDLITESQTGMERATQIVNDMKAMVRIGGTDDPFEDVDLSSLIEGSLRLLRPRLHDTCNVDTDLFAGLNALGREVELSQVIVNLVVNAADACVERGANASQEDAFQPRVCVRTTIEDEQCVIAVEDNGIGIPQHKVSTIFAPLFTTKPKGVGTGLGLGIVQRIISAHEGTIEVKSEPNVGTTFFIRLPLGAMAPQVHLASDQAEDIIDQLDGAMMRNRDLQLIEEDGSTKNGPSPLPARAARPLPIDLAPS